MEISIKNYNVTEQKINVELIPQLISHWKLRRYCSPYNTQFVRVIRQQRAYNLMTLTNNYGMNTLYHPQQRTRESYMRHTYRKQGVVYRHNKFLTNK
jgi:hypothetical protein